MEEFTLPAADAPAEEWGRLAVSIPGWPEAKYPQPSGQITDDHGIEWVYSDQADWDRGGAGNPVPNPDHDGTAGCLLALLGPDVNVIRRAGRTVVTVIMDDPPQDSVGLPHYPKGRGATLGRACIAAAAALGRWPGGVS